ncbi:MAG TPA: efflux RND transporter periplasmic adaptor subunit [Pirellulaceae bacterium]|nr:efflux RND transporter periplasmic adaptor subunit [Pirellulaceae bacterium]
MNTSLAKSLRVFVAVIIVVAAAGGLWFGGMWYAHQQMGMEDGGASGDDMSGMDMGPSTRSMSPLPKQDDMASDVPGYAALKVPPELQQQIGVTTDTVELAPLKMSVKTVGIVRPDETRLSNVYVKTDGWVQEVFVDFVGKTVKEGAPLLSIPLST